MSLNLVLTTIYLFMKLAICITVSNFSEKAQGLSQREAQGPSQLKIDLHKSFRL